MHLQAEIQQLRDALGGRVGEGLELHLEAEIGYRREALAS